MTTRPVPVTAVSGGALTAGMALAVGVVAVSVSGPLIAFAAAPALAIAFWRNALALPVLVPAVAVGRRVEVRSLLRRREGLLCVLAGVALAGHFAAWVPSVRMTSIAASTALVTTQPVWVCLIAVAMGRRLSGWTWLGVACAVGGTVAATGVDLTVSRTALVGDLLALLGGVLGAAYTVLGERVRVSTSTTTYTGVCYGVCAIVLLAVCVAFRVPVTGFPASAWVAIAAVTIGPQLLGHSLFSFALRRVPATTVSVLLLLEAPGAALIAWAWLGQVPDPGTVPGLVLLVAGVATVAAKDRGAQPPAPAAPL